MSVFFFIGFVDGIKNAEQHHPAAVQYLIIYFFYLLPPSCFLFASFISPSILLSHSASPSVRLCRIIVAVSVSLCKNRWYDITSYDLFMLIIYSYVSLIFCSFACVLIFSVWKVRQQVLARVVKSEAWIYDCGVQRVRFNKRSNKCIPLACTHECTRPSLQNIPEKKAMFVDLMHLKSQASAARMGWV